MRRMITLMVVTLCLMSFVWVSPVDADGNGYGHIKKSLKTYFTDVTAKGDFNGSVLVAKDGKVLLQNGFGFADFENQKENKANTVFAVASMGKAFTAFGTLILYERGMLSLNDLVSDYVPDYPYANQMTVYELLNMTAGIADFFQAPALWEGSTKSRRHTTEDLMDYFIDDPLHFEPGTAFEYCNSCYVLLGLIIERVSGQSYRDFVKENIFDPLKMKNTSYDPDYVDTHILGKTAVGYANILTYPPPVSAFLDSTVGYAAGGLYSNIKDMYKWDRALRSNSLISKESLELIFDPGEFGYGFAFFIEDLEVNGETHKMVWQWASYLGHHGFYARFPDDDAAVILLLNYTSPELSNPYVLLPKVQAAADIIFADDDE